MSEIDELPDVLFGQELATTLVLFEEVVASKLGLNATDWRCLGMIVKSKNLTAKDLTEMTGLTTGATTGIIDRLEKKKFVERRKNPLDRRSIIIQPLLTYQEMHSMVGPIFESFGKEMTKLFAQYDQKQIILIINFLKQFMDVIKNETIKIQTRK